MTAQVSFNPLLTTNALGSFSVKSEGYVQGTALDDPAIRNSLAGGVVANSETYPMWGGIAISEDIPTATTGTLGGLISRATALANITGFTVFNQAHAGLTSPQSPVPLYPSGASINFFRLGSGARIALQILAALVSLEGGLITQQVSWDYANEQITTLDGDGALPIKILDINAGNSKTVAFNTGTGFATWTPNGYTAIALI
jgi:hypothetical protein